MKQNCVQCRRDASDEKRGMCDQCKFALKRAEESFASFRFQRFEDDDTSSLDHKMESFLSRVENIH